MLVRTRPTDPPQDSDERDLPYQPISPPGRSAAYPSGEASNLTCPHKCTDGTEVLRVVTYTGHKDGEEIPEKHSEITCMHALTAYEWRNRISSSDSLRAASLYAGLARIPCGRPLTRPGLRPCCQD